MTATATRPRPAPSGSTGRSAGPASPPPTGPPPLTSDPFLGSAVALTVLTLVASLGMGRLFDNGRFALPMIAAAVVAHASAWLGRRLGLGLMTGLLLSACTVGLAIVWVELLDTTAYGIPWAGTWHAADQALSDAWSQFSRVVAPAPTTKGFLMAAMAGVGVTAVLADWAAYRVRTTFEPLLPSFTLFLFASALGAPKHRGLATGSFVAAVLFFLVVHQAALRAETTAWFASRSRGGVGALLQGGLAIGLAAVVAAVFIGPNLPGADAKGLISWRKSGDGGPRDRVTTSPLVDIRGRLVTQSNIEVFTVKSDRRAYWQLTTLDTFDGRIWSSNRNYSSVKKSLPGGISDAVKQDAVVQEFDISALDSIWLPVAYRPTKVEGVKHVSYSEQLGSLISSEATSNGLVYKVESEIPEFRPEALRTAPAVAPDRQFLALPSVPAAVVAEARRITGPHTTAFDKALALQDYFRKGFTYSLDVRPGHDERALERFLLRDKKGYCEQFAGTFAVMARSVGLPSRVAVGFTPGELDADGRYHVRGLNAHAWPEVYLGQFGWVAFEPTPGPAPPGAEAYLGVPEAQADAQRPSVATTAPPTTATSAPDGNSTRTTRPRDAGDVKVGNFDEPKKAMSPVLKAALVLGGLAVAWCVGVPLLLRRRRDRRRAAATTGVDRVVVAWDEACDSLAFASARAARRPAETVHEYAGRAPGAAGFTTGSDVHEAMRTLAAQTAVASYSPGDLPAETVARAMAAADAVGRSVNQSVGWRKRVRRALDPRPLVPRRTREITGKAGSRRAAPA